MKGPVGTPYEGKWFLMFAIFPALYPARAPIFRFSSIPYNMNVASNGRICLSIIDEDYSPSMHIIDIIQQIKKIFSLPSIETISRIDVLVNDNLEEYTQKARESAQRVGKDDYRQFLSEKARIDDNVYDNFELVFDADNAPDYMMPWNTFMPD